MVPRISLIIPFLLSVFSFLYGQKITIVPPVGHTAQITAVDVSRDGKIILTSSVDKTLILWDYFSGHEIVKLSGTEYGMTSCSFAPNAKFVASAGWDKKIRIWSLDSLSEIISWEAHPGGVNQIKILPDSKRIASVGKDGNMCIWTALNGSLEKRIKTSNVASNSLDVSVSGKIIATGDASGKLKIWDGSSFTLIKEISTGSVMIKSISISADERIIAIAGQDFSIKVFDVNSSKLLFDFKADYQMWSAVSISADSKKLAATSFNGFVYEWNLENGALIFSKQVNTYMGTAITYMPDSKNILSCGAGNEITVLRADEGKVIKTFKGYTSSIESITFRKNDNLLASAHWDSRIRLFNLYKCKLEGSIFVDNYILNDIMFSPKKNEIVISAQKPGVSFYRLDEKKLKIENFSEHGANNMAISKNGKFIAVAVSDSCIVYDADNFNILAKSKHITDARAVAFSNDDKLVFSAGRDSVLIVTSIETGKEIRRIKKLKSKAESIAVSPDNIHIAIGLWTGEILIVNQQSLAIEKTIKPHHWIVSTLMFNPIDNSLLSASWDKNVCLTDWVNSKEIGKYSGHTNSVMTASFSSDGRYIFSGGWDNQIKIIDTKKMVEICTIIPIDEEDYLIITPEMYYMGTPDAAKKICFSIGMNTFNFDQFDLQYNRPDKVIEAIPFADKALIPMYKKAYEKRLQKTGFNMNHFDTKINAPHIEITNLDKIEFYTKNTTVELQFKALDTLFPINRYNVFVNGVSIFGSNGKDITKTRQYQLNEKQVIKLSEGLNYIEVSCFNNAGVESLRKNVEIFYQPSKPSTKNLYIIALAVSEYKNPKFNLKYTLNDGREIVKTLSETSGFDQIFIDTLFGIDCTTAKFLKLKEKLKNTSEDDLVILHLSGHGLLDKNLDFYYATYDVIFENPSENGLPYNIIENLMDGIPARNKLILIDACHSGEIDHSIVVKENKEEVRKQMEASMASRGIAITTTESDEDSENLENSFDLIRDFFADVRKGTGTLVISASTGVGLALEYGKIQHGIFTYVLLKAIREKEADVSADNIISVSELRDYVLKQVEILTDGYQKATSRKDNVINDFIIYR